MVIYNMVAITTVPTDLYLKIFGINFINLKTRKDQAQGKMTVPDLLKSGFRVVHPSCITAMIRVLDYPVFAFNPFSDFIGN